MTTLYKTFRRALTTKDGALLGSIFSHENPDRGTFAFSTNHERIRGDVEYEISGLTPLRDENTRAAWVDTLVAYWKIAYILERDDGADVSWAKAYEGQKDLLLAMVRGYTKGNWPHWTLPVMYQICLSLRAVAILSDDQARRLGKASEHLEDAARYINKAFTLCISDRAPIEESRKWGTYYIVNLMFKTYFKLNSVGLAKNILRVLPASLADMPPLEAFPKSHIVTFKYYCGVVSFLEEDYGNAEIHLTYALNHCKADSTRNKELILTYLIPTTMLTKHKLPTPELLSRFPRLATLFNPVCKTIKSGNLQAFDAALRHGEEEFVKRRIYLTLERTRDIAMRNLFRKVVLYQNEENRTKIPVRQFQIAMGCAGRGEADGDTVMRSTPERVEVEVEEVECLLANMIYKGLMKGYISRERQTVVLSGKEPFPGTVV
ncbi:hypothetical protein C7212DRAFT_282317 [Tuber magnatum]|uniref:PCI domain-containing protein n=1 Tax=Tuber magnatum TaxID=42249 RepID=A0A317SNQ4_9PEZI|nr:hypothetical protein C7212DRAFT_282317 [Tuber magnatum]